MDPYKYMRMTPQRFDHLLSLVGPELVTECRPREPIAPSERLALTLRYLASGDSQRSPMYAYRISCTSISHILRDTSLIIRKKLIPLYLKAPASVKEWKLISDAFYETWNIPHCVGAIDGKHT